MTISFVAGSANSNNAVSGPFSASYSAAIQVGDLLIVKAASGPGVTWAITDTQGNLYKNALAFDTVGFSNFTLVWARAKSISAAGANVVNVVPSAGGGDACLGAYRGFLSSPIIASTSTSSGDGPTASVTSTAYYANALIIGGANVANNVNSVGGGSTNRITDAFGDNLQDIIIGRGNSLGGIYTPTALQTSGQWQMGMVVFIPVDLTRPIVRPIGI